MKNERFDPKNIFKNYFSSEFLPKRLDRIEPIVEKPSVTTLKSWLFKRGHTPVHRAQRDRSGN